MSAVSTAPPATPRPLLRRRRRMGSPISRSGPLTYLVAFVFVGICLAPVLYIIIGGVRTNSQITMELEEAASIDGAGRLGFFFRMVVPRSVPGVVTTGILAFIASWNAYLLPLFILNEESSYTLPLGVQAFASQYSVDTARVLAFTSLSMIPALIFFSLFERRIVGGLTGAIKG